MTPSPQTANRDRGIVIVAMIVGVLLTVAFSINAFATVNQDEPATSDDINRFVSCVQNVVFADPALVAEVRQSTIGQPTPAAATFCDELAVRVSEASTTSTSTTGTTLQAPP